MRHQLHARTWRKQIGRRDLIAMLGGAAVAWPEAARAAAGRPRIAVLALNSKNGEATLFPPFQEGLQKLGYFDGRTVDIDRRYADAEIARLPALARELIGTNPNVMYADTPSAAIAGKNAAPSLPIVCPTLNDAVMPSLVASYNHPGGSVTGLSVSVEGLFGKLVEITIDAIPGISKCGLLLNPTGPDNALNEGQVRAAAKARGTEVVVALAGKREELGPAIQQLAIAQVRAIIVPSNAFFFRYRPLLIELALDARMPTVFAVPDGPAEGGLLSYGVDGSENARRAANYVDKILKGASPGDLPIEFPTKLLLIINLKTARALSITVSREMLLRADRVIE